MYKDLKLSDRARIIEMAVRSGITDLDTIEEVYNTFAEGGDLEEPAERRKVGDHYLTLEQYKELQRDTIRQAAVQKALTRNKGVAPIIDGQPASSCIYTFTDNYGRKYQVAGTQTFAANPEKYGFEVAGPVKEGMEGNMYLQLNEFGVPYHATMITGYTDKGEPLLTYSSGHAGGSPGGPIPRESWNSPDETYEHYLERYNRTNSPEADYHKNTKVWRSPQYETYRFIGTPDDNIAWEEQYNQYQAAPVPVGTPEVLNNRVITAGYANGGHMYGPGGDKSISLPQMIAATRSWLSNPENKKKAAFKLGAAAKQGAGLSPLQIVMALGKENPEYDELEAYLYGPERFYTQYKGTSKGPLADEKYQGIPQYQAELNPRGEYVIPKDMKQLVLDAAKSGTNIYINADNLYDPGSVRFDAANHPVKFRYKNGKLVADAADLYDFDEGYVDRYSEKKNPIKKAILRKEIKEMQSVGTPYIVRQEGIPVRFAGDGPSEDPWVDDIEAENFEEAFKRGETGKGYNWKGAIENVKNRMAAPKEHIKEDGGPDKQNWFTRMMMNSVLNDPKDGAVAVSAGWTRDKNGNVIQTEEAANSEGAKKLRENLAEIASMPLTDLGVEVAGAAIAGTKAYKSYKLAKELNKALKSGEFNAALKTTEEVSTPIVKAAATNTKAANAATKSISGKDVEVQALRKRFNKWAEYYGYDTIPESMSVEDAEKAMKKTFDRHNTFFRGVHMPDRPADIAHLEEVFGPGYTEQQAFPYIATHARPEEAGVFVSPASNAGIYGGSGKTAVVRRGYSLGENPQTWLKDADFEIGFGGSNEAVEAAGRNNTLLFPWNEGAPVGGAVENELLAPNGVLNFVEYVPEGATPAYYDATGSLNKYLGKRWVMHGGRQSFLDEMIPKPEFKEGGKIHIKPENRGKFTALKKRTGHSASWFKAHGTPAQKKMATFALNAKKWKHSDGGLMTKF